MPPLHKNRAWVQARHWHAKDVLKAWAIANGTYHPDRDKPNPSVWKRNVRSALNRKSEVQLIEDHSSDSSDPHKIYEIVNQSSRSSFEGTEDSQEVEDGISLSADSPWLEEVAADPCNLINLRCALEELEPLSNPVQECGVLQVYSHSPAQEERTQQVSLMEQIFPQNTLATDFEVKVFYRGVKVLTTMVQNKRGFRLTSDPVPGPQDLEAIVLPEPSAWIKDQKVASMINMVLRSLVPGLLLDVQGGSICGMRTGKCRGFWTMTQNPPAGEPHEVLKEEYTILYTTQQFVTELIEFIERRRSVSPLYSIWLCLGELWPDVTQKPWNKKLIMVQVTPVVFKMLHEMSYSTGASSLQDSDVNLQISDSLSSNNLLAFLQEWGEKMEVEV
ncbi:hypothetical protein NDU88_010226 [Pleurodeles waltl]|uniref:IRF tryptophan pentad repeat domain-containing protein n=1 Tax=Pleurodeles waltl TaxID=8319 RepID=A0AAV7PV31_PLEWA|nr:hypothetical protein NDU88_010226 [Pleurodeles waltl]